MQIHYMRACFVKMVDVYTYILILIGWPGSASVSINNAIPIAFTCKISRDPIIEIKRRANERKAYTAATIIGS